MFIYVCTSNFSSGPQGMTPEDGVAVFDFDVKTGAFRQIQHLKGFRNPTYLARHPKLPVLYMLERWVNPDRKNPTPESERADQKKSDGSAAFAIDPKSGELTLMGRYSSYGLSPMHLNVHPNGRYILFANPGLPKDPDPASGHVTAVRIKPDGALGELAATVQYAGLSPTWRHERPKPYPHSAFTAPDWKRVFVCNLVADRVTIYRFDEKTGALTPSEQPYAQVSSGAGPRHMAFHPGGRFFYVLNEYDATISAFVHDPETGAAAIVQTASFQPADFVGKKSGSHVLVGPGGRFLYCSNRSHRSIAIFAIDQQTGELRLIRHQSAMGKRQRDFIFDPTGRMFLVTNQDSGEVVSFHVDPDSGDLRPTGHTANLPNANCVVFGPQ